MQIKKLFLFAVIMTSSICMYSQDSTFKVNITSPTAASLGKYADIPVNYNTGIPNISIPIYTVKSAKLSLPISLSYHASGLKVQEQASWVGAGWSLNAGGVITRTVVGQPDDRGYASYNNCTNGYFSDSGYNNYLFIYAPGRTGSTSDGMWADDQSFVLGYKDGEPDLFFFNFNGYTGKFYFNDDRTPVLVPEADLKIIPSFALGPGFTGFEVITPDGVQYYFGSTGNTGTTAPVETTVPSTVQGGPGFTNMCASAWYLNKIISADGLDSIKLNYQPEGYSDYAISMFPKSEGDLSAGFPTGVIGYNVIKDFIQGVRLSQITFPNGTVTLNPSATPRTDLTASYTGNSGMYDADNIYSVSNPNPSYSLGNIQISDGNGFCKKYSFYYGYFHDNSSVPSALSTLVSNANFHSDAYRLRLDSLQESSCDATLTIPSYKFIYFSEQVPRKLSFGIDHWGFYNGVTSNSLLIPTLTLQSGITINYVQGANRDASWPAMRGGALQQIAYPTGGTTTFDYESHQTWVNYTTYIETTRGSTANGSGIGQPSPTPLTINFSGNIYKITLDLRDNSGPINGSATANFADLSVTSTRPHAEEFIQTSGSYTYNLYTNNLGPSDWASATVFEEVPNNVQQNAMVGGLRIKTITTNDGITSNNIITSYNYNTGSQSSGILYSRPVYVQNFRNDVEAVVQGFCNGSPNGCATSSSSGGDFFISPGSILPMSTTQGNHIGYNQVTVSQTGNGSSVYRYYGSNVWDYNVNDVCVRSAVLHNCASSIPNYPYSPLPFEYLRGELKYEGHYDQTGHILKDAWFFPKFVQDTLTTPGYIAVGTPYFTGTTYQLQSAYKVKDSTVATDYDLVNSSTAATTTISYYGSCFHHQPTRKVTMLSTRDSVAANLRYAYDFRIAACDALTDSLQYYLSSVHTDSLNFYSSIGTCTPQNCNIGNTNASTNCHYVLFQQLRRDMALARIAFRNRRLKYFTGTNNQFQTNRNAAKASADAELKPILVLQDEYKNTVIETSSYKNTNLTSASFNRFDYGLNGSQFVYPNKLQTLFPTTLAATFTNAGTSTSGTSVTKDSRYTDESLYKFNQGNPVEATGKDGVTTSYLWGYNNVLPIAKAVGTDYATLSAAYQAAGNNLTSLRSQFSISGAQLSTYTYLPILGMTGQTDASGKTVTYEYDKLGRLVVIRDQNGNVVKKYDYQYKSTGQ